jgi:hypothetical protein
MMLIMAKCLNFMLQFCGASMMRDADKEVSDDDNAEYEEDDTLFQYYTDEDEEGATTEVDSDDE